MAKGSGNESPFFKYLSWAFFYFHLFTYIGVNALLIIINLLETPQTLWFIIPLSFWGLMLLGHFILGFFLGSDSAKKWRESHIHKIANQAKLSPEELEKTSTVRLFCWMFFYFHLAVFLGSSVIMAVINYIASPQENWSVIVISAWSLWVLFHYILSYLTISADMEAWRNKKIKTFSKNNTHDQHAGKLCFGFWLAFRTHLFLFMTNNTFLIILDLTLNHTGKRWFWYPLLGWGIVLIGHWILTTLILSSKSLSEKFSN